MCYIQLLEEQLPTFKIFIKFFHIAYADDHLTILAVRIEKIKGTRVEKVDILMKNIKNINDIISTTRFALKQAIEMMGSTINPLKTEIILSPSLAHFARLAKTEFKWLGYTFLLDHDYTLKITKTQFIKKSIELTNMLQDLFAYINDMKVRHRIYKVWAAPVLEFFMLQECPHRSIQLLSGAFPLMVSMCIKVEVRACIQTMFVVFVAAHK